MSLSRIVQCNRSQKRGTLVGFKPLNMNPFCISLTHTYVNTYENMNMKYPNPKNKTKIKLVIIISSGLEFHCIARYHQR